MKMLKLIAAGALALSLAACGQSVPAGNVGVKVKNFGGDAGVQTNPLTTGWHGQGWGEDIILYPTTQKVYSYQAKAEDGVSGGGEQIQFADSSGLQLDGDVAITVRIDPARAPAIYQKYRLDVDQLIHGPLRTAVRSAIKDQSRLYTAEQIYSGAESKILLDALKVLQARYAQEGIEIIALDWIGNIRYPRTVLDAITLKTAKLQQAEAAKADEARAVAQANADVAKARGDAEAMRIRGESLRSNPQILEQEWIAKWNGQLPTYVGGQGTFMMVNPAR